MPVSGKARQAPRCHGIEHREPGYLPLDEGHSARRVKSTPHAITEVVMATSAVSSVSLSDRITAGIVALIIGGFLVFGAGLANSATIHDTAHDVRHSFGFPCH